MMFFRVAVKALVLFNILILAGCSSNGGFSNIFPSTANNQIKIESDPSGADVYVMGEKIGVTPLKINPKDVFPDTYPKEKESVYGKIIIKKAGCPDFTRTVSVDISSNGLKAQLDCGDIYPASPRASKDAPRINETAEQRLDKIKNLLDKGLITEEEAKKARERVLNDL
jgi:hypothetical protein